MKSFQPEFKVLLLSFLTLSLCVSPAGLAGGRSDEGGRMGGLSDGKADYSAAFPPNLGAPKVSVVDPMTRETRPQKGCKIPTGEIDYLEQSDLGRPNAELSAGTRDMEHRIAPVDNCKTVQIWSFYRSRENQQKYYKAPKACERGYNNENKSIAFGQSEAWVGYYCKQVSLFSSRDAALKANAQFPYAYVERENLVIEGGALFSTRLVDIYSQRTSRGKVTGTTQMSLLPQPFGLVDPDGRAVTDERLKALGIKPIADAQKNNDNPSQAASAAQDQSSSR